MTTPITRTTPVRDALLRLLAHAGDTGITTAELAVRMGKTTQAINNTLCRLRAYGYVRRVNMRAASAPFPPHELNRWTLP